ncbi:hypothetical protein RRG08_040037 [Elysia crispata]|uniref:Uncharacterized protein n=1 Tax=Elysia crispata TaxID=231223 RepID=A0AAE0Z9E0_9GAST|nr:hypothetical protein RRG08_040037 [Elysia crispata]
MDTKTDIYYIYGTSINPVIYPKHGNIALPSAGVYSKTSLSHSSSDIVVKEGREAGGRNSRRVSRGVSPTWPRISSTSANDTSTGVSCIKMKSLGSSWSKELGRFRGSGRGPLGKPNRRFSYCFRYYPVFSSPLAELGQTQDQLKSLEYSILTENRERKR